MRFNYSKLRGRIIEKFGSYANFAKALGKSEIIVSKKLNNKSSFSQKSMTEWGNLLDIEANDYGIYFCALEV